MKDVLVARDWGTVEIHHYVAEEACAAAAIWLADVDYVSSVSLWNVSWLIV